MVTSILFGDYLNNGVETSIQWFELHIRDKKKLWDKKGTQGDLHVRDNKIFSEFCFLSVINRDVIKFEFWVLIKRSISTIENR